MADSSGDSNPTSSSSSSAHREGAGDTHQTPGRGGMQAVIDHFSMNKTDAVLMVTRFCTVLFTFMYLIPIFGVFSPYACYQKALIANAATSALRLHQRLPRFQMTREFIALVLLEDSCHYLLYSIIFLYNQPITLSLLPIALFAFLHLSSFSVTLFDKAGNRGSFGNALRSIVENNQRSILQTISLCEIFLMPCIVLGILSGAVSLFAPFLYYRFVYLRYASRRNPYTRQMFHELRIATEALIYKPSCPQIIRGFIGKFISLMEGLAPPLTA